MEEKPPTQAGRDVPRSRTPRSTFGTPDQPTPPSKPAERAPRRSKAAPAVTFQAPAPDENTSPEATPGRKPTQRSQSGRAPAKKAPAAKAAPPAKDAAKAAAPAKAAAAKATPSAKAAAETAAPAEQAAKAAAPAKKAAAATAKAAPAKRAPKKIPAQSEAIDTAPPPRDKPARAKKATAKTTAGNAGKSDQLDAVPAQPAADATPPAKAMPTQVAVSSTGGAAQPQPTIFSKVAADPGHAPELLALAAVQSIGPRAKEWAKRTREAYPKATDAAVARLAADQFTRFTSPTSIVTALAGSYAPSTLIATTALTHARVILHVAAAYGIDPTDEARAADLLVLTRIQPSREDAEAALAAARRKQAATDTVKRIARMVATNAAGWVAVKLVSRYFPGTSLLAAALVSRSSARNMAERATTYYSQASHALGSTV